MPVYKTGGSVIVRDGRVGTEQACCCEEQCGCSFREGSSIVVTVDGNDVEFSSPFSVDGDYVQVCVSGNEYLPDSYCESRYLSTAGIMLFVGCHDADFWAGETLAGLGVDIPGNWPESGVVVLVRRDWISGSIYPECFGGSGGASRNYFYRMVCDDEGYPSVGELFHDSGNVNESGDTEYLCFDCTNEPSANRDCEQLSEPTSVSVVVNPLP